MRYVILEDGSPLTLRFVTIGGEGIEKSKFQRYVIYGRPHLGILFCFENSSLPCILFILFKISALGFYYGLHPSSKPGISPSVSFAG